MVQDILTRVPNAPSLHYILALLCLEEPRDIPRYLDEMRKYAMLRHSEELLELAGAGEPAYQQHGEQAMWRAMLETEQRLHPDGRPTYVTAQIEATLGMKDAALRDLTELQREHNAGMIGLDIDTLLAPLRDDPRFEQLVAQVGLPRRTSYRG